jgi:hypothetical protein
MEIMKQEAKFLRELLLYLCSRVGYYGAMSHVGSDAVTEVSTFQIQMFLQAEGAEFLSPGDPVANPKTCVWKQRRKEHREPRRLLSRFDGWMVRAEGRGCVTGW